MNVWNENLLAQKRNEFVKRKKGTTQSKRKKKMWVEKIFFFIPDKTKCIQYLPWHNFYTMVICNIICFVDWCRSTEENQSNTYEAINAL